MVDAAAKSDNHLTILTQSGQFGQSGFSPFSILSCLTVGDPMNDWQSRSRHPESSA